MEGPSTRGQTAGHVVVVGCHIKVGGFREPYFFIPRICWWQGNTLRLTCGV